MYKSSFLFFSVVLAAAAASLQSGGARWGDFSFELRAESHADIASINEDMRFFRVQAKSAPVVLRTLWFDVRSNLKELKADAVVESKVAAGRISAQDR